MPQKIRELKVMLRAAGFTEQHGKGSHTKWLHPLFPGRITISGKDGSDAKPYQTREVLEAIRIVEQNQDE